MSYLHNIRLRLTTPLITAVIGAQLIAGPKQPPVPMRVFVPLPAADITKVTWGKVPVKVTRISSAQDTPVVILADEHSNYQKKMVQGEIEALLAEKDLALRPSVEIWCCPKYGLAAPIEFRSGFFSAPRVRFGGTLRIYFGGSWSILAASERFRERGPLRIVSLSTRISWLDGRGSNENSWVPRSYWSPLEEGFGSLGSSGSTLFPIIVSSAGKLDESKREAKWGRWAAWMMGSTPYILEETGLGTLTRVIRESDRGSVVELEVPGRTSPEPEVPKTLRIWDRQGNQRYSRPLFRPDKLTGPRPASYANFRIVQALEFGEATTTQSCMGQTAPQGQALIHFSDVANACGGDSACSMRVEVSVGYNKQFPRGLSSRNGTYEFRAQGNEACLGPLETSPGIRVGILSTEWNWMTLFEMRELLKQP